MYLENKVTKLKQYIKALDSFAVAFSSGVDSTFLLKIAHEQAGDKIIAVTAKSSLFPEREFNEAINFCKKEGIKHIIIEANELNTECFRQNPPNRCYLCKKELFKKFLTIAEENNIKYVVEGSNADDIQDYRPGMRAVKELGIKSPLLEAGLTKAEIRILSKQLGLSTWEKPSFACLASRFVYGEEISEEKLKMVENAEEFLRNAGFKQVRVRIHNNLARIEVMPEEFEKLLQIREKIISEFKTYGFNYITMDLTGYRTGSMNEPLKLQ